MTPSPQGSIVPELAPGHVLAERYTVEQTLVTAATYRLVRVRCRLLNAAHTVCLLPALFADRLDELVAGMPANDVLDAHVDGESGLPFVVLETIDGHPLRERPPPARELEAVLRALEPAVRQLARARAQHVAHGALSPAHVFVSGDTLTVWGIGLAHRLLWDDGIPDVLPADPVLPEWLAPDVSKAPSAASDVYSFALLAAELVYGRPYWQAEDLSERISAAFMSGLQAPSERYGEGVMPPAMAAHFDDWFARCTRAEPADRLPDVASAFDALRAPLWDGPPIAASFPPVPVPIEPIVVTANPKGIWYDNGLMPYPPPVEPEDPGGLARRRRIRIIAASVAIAALALFAWLVLR